VNRPLETCRQCRGTGKHELRPRIWATLQLLTEEYQTMDTLMRLHRRVKRTALIGRLMTLRDLGLAERKHSDDRGYDWRRTQYGAR
jgi:hypothetical protein